MSEREIYKAKDLKITIPFPTIQIVPITTTADAVAADIGHDVYSDATTKKYVGKLLGFTGTTTQVWYVETINIVATGLLLGIHGGTGTGTTSSASTAGIQIYLELDGYTDCVPADIGDIVTDDGGNVGPLVDYDNEGQKRLIACATATVIADNSLMAGLGTGAGTANGASISEATLAMVEGLAIELIHEGGMEFTYGKNTGEVGYGPKHATFTIRRWFFTLSENEDLLFDLFNEKIAFDLEGTLLNDAGAEIANSVIRLRKCRALRWRPVTGTANDTVAEEVVGEAEDWIRTTPTG